jgi:hypothetical protein
MAPTKGGRVIASPRRQSPATDRPGRVQRGRMRHAAHAGEDGWSGGTGPPPLGAVQLLVLGSRSAPPFADRCWRSSDARLR